MFLPGSDVPSASWLDNLHVDKLVHCILFGVLILLAFLPILKSHLSLKSQKQYLLVIALSCVLWGILIEVIQHNFIAGRSFDLWDWVADTAGTALGVWVILMLKKSLG